MCIKIPKTDVSCEDSSELQVLRGCVIAVAIIHWEFEFYELKNIKIHQCLRILKCSRILKIKFAVRYNMELENIFDFQTYKKLKPEKSNIIVLSSVLSSSN